MICPIRHENATQGQTPLSLDKETQYGNGQTRFFHSPSPDTPAALHDVKPSVFAHTRHT